MDIDMPLEEYAKKNGGRGRGHRRGWTQPRKGPAPGEVEKMHGGGRRGGGGSNKAEVVSVVFGNGTPEKIVTGRLSERMLANTKPANLVQSALERGNQTFLKKHSQSREKGGKRQSSRGNKRKRNVIQHPLLRKLRIVRPSDPNYKRELKQLRNRTYAVRLSRNSSSSSSSSSSSRRSRSNKSAPAAAATAPVAAGPMSDRFSSLKRK